MAITAANTEAVQTQQMQGKPSAAMLLRKKKKEPVKIGNGIATQVPPASAAILAGRAK